MAEREKVALQAFDTTQPLMKGRPRLQPNTSRHLSHIFSTLSLRHRREIPTNAAQPIGRLRSSYFIFFSVLLRFALFRALPCLALPCLAVNKIETSQKGFLQAAQRLNLMDDRLMQASGARQDKGAAGGPGDQGGEGGGEGASSQGPVRGDNRPKTLHLGKSQLEGTHRGRG